MKKSFSQDTTLFLVTAACHFDQLLMYITVTLDLIFVPIYHQDQIPGLSIIWQIFSPGFAVGLQELYQKWQKYVKERLLL